MARFGLSDLHPVCAQSLFCLFFTGEYLLRSCNVRSTFSQRPHGASSACIQCPVSVHAAVALIFQKVSDTERCVNSARGLSSGLNWRHSFSLYSNNLDIYNLKDSIFTVDIEICIALL